MQNESGVGKFEVSVGRNESGVGKKSEAGEFRPLFSAVIS
jgi:hypothetical protein